MRLYIPLAPIVILAAVVSVNACGKQPREPSDRLRVVPPPAALAEAPPPRPAAFRPAPEPPRLAESLPSPEEVKAFEKPVAK